uniref:Uncharacterized protein n=1 Tax=Oryza sativa subsp. japonica TaxID=39947 RepID=Q6ZD73_ORYSJ|nr:hypothetical protein [Oryza sativa Japonica Group]
MEGHITCCMEHVHLEAMAIRWEPASCRDHKSPITPQYPDPVDIGGARSGVADGVFAPPTSCGFRRCKSDPIPLDHLLLQEGPILPHRRPC